VDDAWIAASAVAYDCPLVTHNPGDFGGIEDLKILTEKVKGMEPCIRSLRLGKKCAKAGHSIRTNSPSLWNKLSRPEAMATTAIPSSFLMDVFHKALEDILESVN
jgi:hypothetical protein